MSEQDRAELSAFLDGELDPARARQVEALIGSDASLKAEFERLTLADRRLRSIADAAAFRPEVRLPAAAAKPASIWLAAPLLLILLGWAAGKLSATMTTALAVNAASLLLLLAVLTPLALREARAARPAIP